MRGRALAFSTTATECHRKISHLLRNGIQKERLAAAAALLKSRVCSSWAESVVHEDQNAKRYYVSGMVQGVGYRYFVERAARYLKVAGYVRNLRDGRVEAYAIGPAASLTALRETLERGPNGASVTSVAEEDAAIDVKFADGFSIEYDT
jgi:acylphosphatase